MIACYFWCFQMLFLMLSNCTFDASKHPKVLKLKDNSFMQFIIKLTNKLSFIKLVKLYKKYSLKRSDCKKRRQLSQCSLRANRFNLVLRRKFNLFLVLMHDGDWKQFPSNHITASCTWWDIEVFFQTHPLQLETHFTWLITYC